MATVNLSGMSVEALMDLRKRVDEMLLERRRAIAILTGRRGKVQGSALKVIRPDARSTRRSARSSSIHTRRRRISVRCRGGGDDWR